MAAKFQRRFQELCEQADAIEASKRFEQEPYKGNYIDQNKLLNWSVKAQSLLLASCGPESVHLKQFVSSEKTTMYTTSHEILLKLRAIFEAAKEDYEGGYLNSLRLLVQAEVFDSELEQASELLAAGYTPAAAVTAGVVLEAGLREWCVDKGIPIGKLDKMNSDLAKADAYNKLVQKQITALADIRNNAAHGHYDQFSKANVADMITDVQRILANRNT